MMFFVASFFLISYFFTFFAFLRKKFSKSQKLHYFYNRHATPLFFYSFLFFFFSHFSRLTLFNLLTFLLSFSQVMFSLLFPFKLSLFIKFFVFCFFFNIYYFSNGRSTNSTHNSHFASYVSETYKLLFLVSVFVSRNIGLVPLFISVTKRITHCWLFQGFNFRFFIHMI